MKIRWLVVAGLFFGYLGPALLATKQEAQLHGEVEDFTGRPVGGAVILLTSMGRLYMTRTAGDGGYQLLLPRGTYEMRVTSDGFCSVRRAPFTIKRGMDIGFDFELIECAIVDVVENRPAELPPPLRTTTNDQYPQEELETIGGKWPLISYGIRSEQAGVVHYSGLLHRDIQLPVVFTYDLLTVEVDQLSYSKKDAMIEGTGNIVWENGKQTQRGKIIFINFSQGKPHVTLVR